jgi:hypothetical protein
MRRKRETTEEGARLLKMYKLIIIMHWQMVRNVVNAEARSDRPMGGKRDGEKRVFKMAQQRQWKLA